MTWKDDSDLCIIFLLTIVLIILILFVPVDFLRILIGFPFVVLFPGYSLLQALFPRRNDLSGSERFVISFGLSIAVVALIGLALNYMPWGITILSSLIVLSLFIIIMLAVAVFRRRRVPVSDRYRPIFILNMFNNNGANDSGGESAFTKAQGDMTKHKWVDKALYICLALSMVCILGVIIYLANQPKPGDEYTEFYMLGPDGKAENYPKEIKLGNEVQILLGIVNHERDKVSYRIDIVIDGNKNKSIELGTIARGEKWEQVSSFKPLIIGDNQKAEFLLYNTEQYEPKSNLRIWLNVK